MSDSTDELPLITDILIYELSANRPLDTVMSCTDGDAYIVTTRRSKPTGSGLPLLSGLRRTSIYKIDKGKTGESKRLIAQIEWKVFKPSKVRFVVGDQDGQPDWIPMKSFLKPREGRDLRL